MQQEEKLQWEALLSTEKLRAEKKGSESASFKKYPINEFEIDYNKIVSSAAFRRLQDKTQVFPLDKCDFIRTRLTHSIEVSTIARQLGIMVTQNKTGFGLPGVDDKNEKELQDKIPNIPSILMCAGLLHDVGNPPFGHFGEAVIGDWFQENLDKITYKGDSLRERLEMRCPLDQKTTSKEAEDQASEKTENQGSSDTKKKKSEDTTNRRTLDLENFEGNAQALRILLKAKRGGDLNISKAIIGTLVKYPNSSTYIAEQAKKLETEKSKDIKRKKLGFYQAEEAIFENEIAIPLGLKMKTGEFTRHPLTYLLEAADDIAYATADLEDGFKKGLFTLDQFIQYFETYPQDDELEGPAEQRFEKTKPSRESLIKELKDIKNSLNNDQKALAQWLNGVRHRLMYCAAFRFLCQDKNNDTGMQIQTGYYENDLFFDTFHEFTVSILKDFMVQYGFQAESVLRLELSAKAILSFLLDKFVHAMLYIDKAYQEDGYKPTKEDKKYKNIFSQSLLQDYKNAKTGDENYDLYLRLLMVTDYISGMTDGYARDLYRELKGID